MCSPGNWGVDVSTPNTTGSTSILQNLENGKYQVRSCHDTPWYFPFEYYSTLYSLEHIHSSNKKKNKNIF